MIGRLLDNLLLKVLILLRTLIHEIGLLTSHGIEVGVYTWLSTNDWSDDWLHAVLHLLRLLLVHILRRDGRGRELLLHLACHTQIHALELLSSCLDAHELLLESLLLLRKIHVGSNQLSIQVWIHRFLTVFINQNLRRRENLLWNRIHLTIVVDTHLIISILLIGEMRCLGSTVCLLLCIIDITLSDVVLLLRGRSGRRESAGSSRLWSRSQACEQVRS